MNIKKLLLFYLFIMVSHLILTEVIRLKITTEKFISLEDEKQGLTAASFNPVRRVKQLKDVEMSSDFESDDEDDDIDFSDLTSKLYKSLIADTEKKSDDIPKKSKVLGLQPFIESSSDFSSLTF